MPDNGKQGRLLWCDAEANLDYLSIRQGVIETVDWCKKASINTIIVDVKPLCGRVLCRSQIAPRLLEWKGKSYPRDYDLLQTMIEHGHSQGMSVHAAVNVFSEGSQEFRDGPAFQHPEWQCIRYELDEKTGRTRFVRVADAEAEHLAVFVNPILPEVREYEIDIAAEIAGNYDIDGITFDRMRYPNIYADFSDASRASFEQYIEAGVPNWPEDIFRIDLRQSGSIIRGSRFNQWCEWRAWQIKSHLMAVTDVIKSIRPKALTGVYVGSWHSQYYSVGVNWGSERYRPRLDWTTENYNEMGYAEIADYICAGCYYEIPTREEARLAGAPEGATVEAGADEAMQAVMGAAPVYGSLYVRQYEGDPDRFRRAVKAAARRTQGIMLFDLVHISEYGWWPVVVEELRSLGGKNLSL